MQKPILPKGTRDFNSEELYKRNYIINIIKDNFLDLDSTQLKLQVLRDQKPYWENMAKKGKD